MINAHLEPVFNAATATQIIFQRVRLDCDREASHNLNRLLDKPGGAAMILLVMEISL